MSRQPTYAEPIWTPGGSRRYLQPLAGAFVVLLFALLFFSTAMMNLRELEALLLVNLENKARFTVEVIERNSQRKYMSLMQTGMNQRGPHPDFSAYEEAYSSQEALARALVDVARYIDLQKQAGVLSYEEIERMATSERFLSIIVLNGNGRVAWSTGSFPPSVPGRAKTLIDARAGISINILDLMNKGDGTGFVGVRRRGVSGYVLLVLNKESLEYWGARVAIQSAVDEFPWGKGTVYFAVQDSEGRQLVQIGSVPKERAEECLLLASKARTHDGAAEQCVRVGESKFLELSLPFHLNGKVAATARVGLETHEMDNILVEDRKRIFLWAGLMVAIGLLAMGALYWNQNRHVAKMQALRERLSQAERLSSLGKLGAGVAHEIRNPLNAISMAAQRIQRDFAPEVDEKKEGFDRITYIVRDEIKRLNSIVEDFLSLSRNNRMEFRQQSMVDLLERVVFLVRDEAQARGVQIEKQWANPAPMIFMDFAKMEQAILNIVRNAMESITGGGCVTITCAKGRKERVHIKIRDTGAGISAEEQERVFDPFYTTKTNGVGLGLAIAHEIISAHGGDIRVESELGKGTTVQMCFPGKGGNRDKDR